MLASIVQAAWQRYNDVGTSLLWSDDTTNGTLVWTDPDANYTMTRVTSNLTTQRFDDIFYDMYDGTYWSTRQDTGQDEILHYKIHPFSGDISLIEEIYYSDGTATEIEAVCADPRDGTIWFIDDWNNQTVLHHAQRVGDGGGPNTYQTLGSISLYNADPDLGVASGQGLCWDFRTNTLWISANTTERLYNYAPVTSAATLISVINVSGIVFGSSQIQGISYDYYTDTLYVAERTYGAYQITKTGGLIEYIQNALGASGPSGIAVVPRRFPSWSPDVWFKFEETSGTSILDEQYRAPGVADDAITSVPGVIDNGITFESSESQFVTIPALTISGDFTISVWLKFESLGGVLLGDLANNDWLRFDANHTLTYKIAGGSTTYTTAEHGFTWTLGSWTHYIIQRRGNYWNMYQNGVAATAFDTTTRTADFTPIYIGQKAAASYLDADMDELMIFDYCLPDTDVQRLYNNGQGLRHLLDFKAPHIPYGSRTRYNSK